MDANKPVKIKDSVDVFLSNGKYLMAYYMNTRRRKSYRVSDETVRLLESIDGKRTSAELAETMAEEYGITTERTTEVLAMLQEAGIVTESAAAQELLDDEQLDRYGRQINYFSEFLGGELEGIAAQRVLLDSRVLIFGCGAIGGDIAVQLCMAGVGHIALFDYDTVEQSDAARHIYYRESSVGQAKVDVLAKELEGINPDVEITTNRLALRPQDSIEGLIGQADLVIDTLDEPYIGYTAAKISRECFKTNTPHFIAGGFDAHLASTGEMVVPYKTPCVERYADHFKVALKDWKPCKHPVEDRNEEIGGLASMSLFSSSFACIEIIKLLAGITGPEDEFKTRGEFLFGDMSLTYLTVERDPDCPVCGKGRRYEPSA